MRTALNGAGFVTGFLVRYPKVSRRSKAMSNQALDTAIGNIYAASVT